MKTRFFKLKVTFSSALICLMMACGLSQSETRKPDNFNGVDFSLPGSLEITTGSQPSMEIIGDKQDIANIVTKVEGNTLKIYNKQNNFHVGSITIKLVVTSLNKIDLAGSGDIIVKSEIKGPEVDIYLSGSGNIEMLNAQVSNLEATITGSGDILLGGKASSEFAATITGSGDIKADGLASKDVRVNITGSGSVRVNASDELRTNIVGSGSVYYAGNPRVNAQSTGSGKTKPID